MMLGARTAAWSGKKWENPYLMDDLYIHWDAEWNSGGGVHDGNFRMVDLSGNGRDVTLPDSAIINSDNIVFTNNTGAYINRPQGDIQNFARGWSVAGTVDFSDVDKTIEKDISFLFGLGDSCCLISVRQKDGLFALQFSNIHNGLGSTSDYVYFYPDIQPWGTKGGKIHIVGVSDISNDVSTVYINGVKNSSKSGAGISGDQYNSWGRNGFGIGCGAGYNRPSSPTIGTKYFNALFFNRGITADEAAHLFSIDNRRFGIV